MSNLMILTLVSLAGLLVIAAYRFLSTRNLRRFLMHVVVLILCFAFLYTVFFDSDEAIARNPEQGNIYFVIVLYLFMLLGMLAQYIYTILEQPKRQRRTFEWSLFIAPVFASPIVFIPLLSALQNADVDLQHLNAARIMVFLVAFENGFFWKEYFDHRRQLKKEKVDEK